MVLAPLLWSSAGVVTRHIELAPALEQVFWRSLFAFAFVAVVLLVGRKNPLKAGWPGLFSGLMWAIMFTAFVIALSLTSTANTLVTMSVSPLLTVLFARAALSDPVPLRTWMAAAVAGIGIVWMFSSSMDDSGHLAGMLVASAVPVAAALNVVVLRASAAKVDLIPAVMLGGGLSCLLALPFAVPFAASPKDVFLLAMLGYSSSGCRACCSSWRAARCSRPSWRCSACSRWCWGRYGHGWAQAKCRPVPRSSGGPWCWPP
jgi:drug/metabolite transporter (DMT)-like permease